jgi:hypothetical protein
MLDRGHFADIYGGKRNGFGVARLIQLALGNRGPAILSIVLYHSRVDAVEVDMLKTLTADVVARVWIGDREGGVPRNVRNAGWIKWTGLKRAKSRGIPNFKDRKREREVTLTSSIFLSRHCTSSFLKQYFI